MSFALKECEFVHSTITARSRLSIAWATPLRVPKKQAAHFAGTPTCYQTAQLNPSCPINDLAAWQQPLSTDKSSQCSVLLKLPQEGLDSLKTGWYRFDGGFDLTTLAGFSV